MERRTFLKAAPIALAGAAIPVAAEAYTDTDRLRYPDWKWDMEYEELKRGEPSKPGSVIRVEMTPAGLLPVIEMMGPYLINGDVLFDETPWEGVRGTDFATGEPTDIEFYEKNIKAFLRKSDAVCYVRRIDDEHWVCYGAVKLVLVRTLKNQLWINVGVIPESTLQKVEGIYLHPRCAAPTAIC